LPNGKASPQLNAVLAKQKLFYKKWNDAKKQPMYFLASLNDKDGMPG